MWQKLGEQEKTSRIRDFQGRTWAVVDMGSGDSDSDSDYLVPVQPLGAGCCQDCGLLYAVSGPAGGVLACLTRFCWWGLGSCGCVFQWNCPGAASVKGSVVDPGPRVGFGSLVWQALPATGTFQLSRDVSGI